MARHHWSIVRFRHGRCIAVATALLALCGMAAPASSAPVSVLTYHNDNGRTGWNRDETLLTPGAVGASLRRLYTVTLDDQVETEPLVVPGQMIAGVGTRNVAYVATEGDTIYAIDIDSGTVLRSASLGTPVPVTSLPVQCYRAPRNLGVHSTPVIDPVSHILYVVAFTIEAGKFVYRLHALDLSTLADASPPVVINAHQLLVDGSTLGFDAGAEQQRAALLLSGGSIYIGFAGSCGVQSRLGRGWVLRYKAGSLKQLHPVELLDRLATAPDDAFLSSVWMSGYGLAADAAGDVVFVTGDSDRSGTTYNSTNNLSESVVKVAPRLDAVADFFTPSTVGALDRTDTDFGSGGAMLLPPEPGNVPNLAVAAGKSGIMYLMDEDHLGGFTPSGPDQVLASETVGPCWCGPSYFRGSDGIGRIVSSGGFNAIVWKVLTASGPVLAMESATPAVIARHGHGFFTSVSSDGIVAGSAIIWAAAGPATVTTTDIVLYAFDASDGSLLTSAVAGTWPTTLDAPNTMPVVANGKVLVASYRQLAIFGVSQTAR